MVLSGSAGGSLGVGGDAAVASVNHVLSMSIAPECLQSLYVLMILMVPKSPQICIPVMSGEFMCSSVQCVVGILGLTSIMDHVVCWPWKWVGGRTVVQFRAVLVLFRKSSHGS